MKKVKIFVLAYARVNLGDDLFISMLLKRYPDVDFYIKVPDLKYAAMMNNFDNIKVFEGKDNNLSEFDVKEFDMYIHIGGSVFMEGGSVYNISDEYNAFIQRCHENNIPFVYISSNFGPCYTEKYMNLAIDAYNNCADVCFRDKASYNQFKEIKSIRYRPDLVFSYKYDNVSKIKNSVGISVIDLSIRDKFKEKEDSYCKMLKNNILDYVNSGKSVYLFSFCKHEGDENAINKVYGLLPKEIQDKVHIIRYLGNLDEFLNIYSSMEYNICARFHALVLSVVFKQKFYVISYSKKTDNVINDLNLCSDSLKLENINENIKINLNDFYYFDEDKLNNIAKLAEEQFSATDEYIKKLIK